MTKQKSTKRTLLASVLSLVLCITMLIGTTFAWFTDTATSNNNKIVAGNLDVQLLMYDENANATAENGKYVDISANSAPIFGAANSQIAQNDSKDTLWEPGKTQVVYLAIKNNGNLALKYQVVLDVTNPENGKNLYEAMQYVITPNAKDGVVTPWDATNARVPELGKQVVSNGEKELKKGETHYFALSVHMKEEAGNEYQDGAIDFDLNVLATQLNAESDSFGTDYDKDATVGTYVEVNAGEDLLAVMMAAEEGLPLNIKLLGDVEWPTKAGSGVEDVTKASSIVINGNGHTLTATGAGVKEVGDNDAPMTLKNVKVRDKSASYNEGSWELGYLEMGGTVLDCENVTFLDPIMVQSEKATFTNCSFLGYKDVANNLEMNGVWMYNGDATFKGCTFEGIRGMKICDMYPGGEIGTVVIDNCRFIGIANKPGVAIDDCDTKDMQITIKNSTFIGCKPGEQSKYVYETKNTVPVTENNTVDNKTAVVTSKTEFTNAISSAQAGDEIILTSDVDYSSTQLTIAKDVTIDLNNKELTTANNYGGTTLSAGASIKNGIINHTGNTAAIKVSGNASSIENVTINMTPTAGKTKTAIQVYNGKYVESIKNVTITGATQGIEVAKGSKVDLIENVTVKAVPDGAKKGVALLVNAASVGKAVNCKFEGDYGVYMMLNGEFHVGLELDNCTVIGSAAAFIAHDEAGIANTTNCSLTFTYDDDTKFNGEFLWNFEDECQSVVTLKKPQ